MATEKRLISVGDVLYIIGKYGFSPDDNPEVVEVQVAYRFHKNFYGYPAKGHGVFKFANRDLGKTVFYNQKEAERILGRILDASD